MIFEAKCKNREAEVRYFPDAANGWILAAPGPDMIPDITVDVIRDGKIIERTYDPTNGLTSPGDVVVTRRDLDHGLAPYP